MFRKTALVHYWVLFKWKLIFSIARLYGFKIKIAETQTELEDLYAFRYNIYINELSRIQNYADHAHQSLEEPLDQSAYNVIALKKAQIIGTVRVNLYGKDELKEYYHIYDLDRFLKTKKSIAVVTKLMVIKRFRRTPLSILLANACYKIGCLYDVDFTFIDCYPYLIKYFKKLGFNKYKDDAYHQEYGKVSPMILQNKDLFHLQNVHSPFYGMAIKYKSRLKKSNKNYLTKKIAL